MIAGSDLTKKALLEAALAISSEEHKWAGASMHDRIIGELETCCRQGEMLRIQNRHVDWERHQIAIPGAHAKDSENRRAPFDPHGRLAPILKRRAKLGPARSCSAARRANTRTRSRQPGSRCCSAQMATIPTRAKKGDRVDREKLRQVDLHWHDLRHEGACRLLADGVDIRTIQLMLGHADIKQTQRYLNITDEELQEGDDRRVGAPAPVEGAQSVASRGNLSVICQSRPKTRINCACATWRSMRSPRKSLARS